MYKNQFDTAKFLAYIEAQAGNSLLNDLSTKNVKPIGLENPFESERENYHHKIDQQKEVQQDGQGRDRSELVNLESEGIRRSGKADRVAIFIDGSNLFYAASQLGIEIDYHKLLCYLTDDAKLLRAFFYTGVDSTNLKQQNFLLWMRRHGYRVVAKELTQFADGSKKANLDVEIAVDMLTLADAYDTAILISGDGDLAYAVDKVSYKGVRVEVISLRSMTSDSLLNVADTYIDLDSLKEEIQKTAPTEYLPNLINGAKMIDSSK